MLVLAFEIWTAYNKEAFENYIKDNVKVKLDYLQSDNLHHKYNVTAIYPADLVTFGMLIERFYVQNKV